MRRRHHDPRNHRLPAECPGAEDPPAYLGDTCCDSMPHVYRGNPDPTRTCSTDLTADPTTALPEHLTFPELRDLLRVSRNTLYRLSNAGKIPGAYKVGNAWRYPRAALEAWIRGPEPRSARVRKVDRWG